MVFNLEEFSDIQPNQLNTLGYISSVDRLPEKKLSWPPLANLDQKVHFKKNYSKLLSFLFILAKY